MKLNINPSKLSTSQVCCSFFYKNYIMTLKPNPQNNLITLCGMPLYKNDYSLQISDNFSLKRKALIDHSHGSLGWFNHPICRFRSVQINLIAIKNSLATVQVSFDNDSIKLTYQFLETRSSQVQNGLESIQFMVMISLKRSNDYSDATCPINNNNKNII